MNNPKPLKHSLNHYAGLAVLFEPNNIAIIHAINQYYRDCYYCDFETKNPAAYGLTKSNCSFVLYSIERALEELSTLLETLGRTAEHFPADDLLASEGMPILVDCFSTLSTVSGSVIPELIALQQRVDWVQLRLKD